MRVRLLLLMAVSTLLVDPCESVDWPMFHFDPDHSGFSTDVSISRDAVSSRSLVRYWGTTTGGPIDSSPAIVNGIVYVGSDDHRLWAFDASTGSTQWTAFTGGAVRSSPAVANGVAYVGSGDGKLYAFDAAGNTNCSGTPKTCVPLWTAAIGGAVDSSPAVVNGVVAVGSQGNGYLYAFDATGNTNCATTGCSATKTCTPLWTSTTGGFNQSSPAVANGVVYIGSDGIPDTRLYAYDAGGTTNCSGTPKTCAPLWTTAPLGSGSCFCHSSPAVVNGVVYVGSGDGKLYAYDAGGTTNCSGTPKTCTPLWTGATGGSVDFSPAVANGVVYVGSGDGKLYAFDAGGTTNCSGTPKTCTPMWTSTASMIYSEPAVANGVVYAASTDRLYAFDAGGTVSCSGMPKTCSPLWSVATSLFPSSFTSSPAVANKVVYVGSTDVLFPDVYGHVLAFGLEKIAPSTSVVSPSNGATLSGTAALAASATDNVAVSGVEFHLTGAGYPDTRIGVATLTGQNWTFDWDTTSVPNGAYTLTSVAHDPAGNVGVSEGISVTVQNGCG